MEKLKSAVPLPPPLPPNTRFHGRGFSVASAGGPKSNTSSSLDRLFDEAYGADTSISMDRGRTIYGHASILGVATPVLRALLKKSKAGGRDPDRKRSISIRGAPPEAVGAFVRFLYSSRFEEETMDEFALPMLVLSHAYAVPELKRLCERWLEQNSITTENVIDVFQLAMLCDAPRLCLICHRFILSNLKAVSATDGWAAMKESHPVLEKKILESIRDRDARKKSRIRKANERKVYIQLHEAMEALVHICRDGCRTIGPHDKVSRRDPGPCPYAGCKGLEALIRHFAGCKQRSIVGSCVHCKRMWQILELHSRICANSDACGVPLCSHLTQTRTKHNKKEETRWRILVKKVVTSKSITGAPIFRFN